MKRSLVQLTILLCCFFFDSVAFAGAWGVGVFENDDALDFIWEVQNGQPAEPLSAPLKFALRSDGYIDATLGSRILVAAEAYAALNGKPSSELPEDFAKWLDSKSWRPDMKLTGTAENAVKMVLDTDNSELAQLWQESPEDYQKWVEVVEDILKRLR